MTKEEIEILIARKEISENARWTPYGVRKGSVLIDCDCHEQPQP
jgi:hypothetical protein